jgi:hypothetical protein
VCYIPRHAIPLHYLRRSGLRNAKTILAIGWLISETPVAKNYDEAVQLHGMTLGQAAEEIRAIVARAMESSVGRPER